MGEHTVEYLTPNHSPASDPEKSRIFEHGGRIEYDGHSHRVYLGGPGPGLNISRSIGDLQGRSVGIIPNPDVTQVELSKSDRFLVVCSDGVWEFMTTDDVGDVVTKALAAERNPAQDLVLESRHRWNQFSSIVDDTTCIVVDLQRFHERGMQPPLWERSETGCGMAGKDLSNGLQQPFNKDSIYLRIHSEDQDDEMDMSLREICEIQTISIFTPIRDM